MNAEAGRSRQAKLLLAAVVAAIVLGGLWLAYRPSPDLIQGMADTDDIRVSAKVTARIESLQAHEGDDVVAGQVVATLTSPELEAKLAQARAALGAAQALSEKAEAGTRQQDLTAARAQLARAQASAELASKTLARTQNLFAAGVITEQKRDEAVASAAAAAEAARAARAEFDKAVEGARTEDKTAALAQVQQAQAAVMEVTALEEETRVRAPASGQIAKRMANVGELVPAGYPIFTMVDLNRMWVSINLREDQFHGLKIARQLNGDIPALDLHGAQFEAFFINPRGDFATWRATRQSSGYDIKSFEVRLRPVQAVDGLRPGMSVLFDWPQ
jgi:HlyD family secretion protein